MVEHPKILQPNRKLDYGEGFYTTTSEKQAEEWVARRMLENKATLGYVNIYEFDADKSEEFKSLYSPSQPRNGQSLSWQTEPKRSLLTTTTSCMVQ